MPILFPKRTTKTPKKMRYVGIEIECLASKEWAPDHDNDDEDYNDYYSRECLGEAKKFVLNIHDDGSVEGDGYPAEVVTQPLLEKRNKAIKLLCDTIKERGGYTNKTCGGHIHVDAKDLKKAIIQKDNTITAIKFLTLCEPALYAVTGKTRLTNSFCQPLTVSGTPYYPNNQKSWDTSDLFGDRYNSINFCALEDHGTLEFRLFAGTLEHEKWTARTAFSEAIVNKLSAVLKNPKLLDKLHKASALSNFNLEDVIDDNFEKSKLYKDLITNDGVKLIENVTKMVGLHHKYRKILINQHKDIWSKYATKDAQ